MIIVHGPPGTPELDAAERLHNLIIAAWPEAPSDTGTTITIIGGAKLYGQAVQDIDVVVLLSLAEERVIVIPGDRRGDIVVRSLCLMLEVKDLRQADLHFVGTNVYAHYRNGDTYSVSEKGFKQVFALRDYIKSQSAQAPFIVDLIWLRLVAQANLPRSSHNILGGDMVWPNLWEHVEQQVRAKSPGLLLASGVDDPTGVDAAADLLARKIEMTALDRRRVERVAQKVLQEQQYRGRIGQQLLLFRGRGGTGKTVRLLQIAHQLYDEEDAKVLVLTYNVALVADLRRLLTLMGIRTGYDRGRIVVQTVHSFIGQLLTALDVLPGGRDDFLERYEEYKAEALQLIGAIGPEDIERMIRARPDRFRWDLILVDEAQDWPADERDLLYHIYDYRRFAVADGVDQLVRGARGLSWRERYDHMAGAAEARLRSQVVSLRKSLRLKAGLCRFASAFAAAAGLEWDVEPDLEVYGGRVIILEGRYSEARDLHDQVVADLRAAGNEPIDMLVCVPPDQARWHERPGDGSAIAERLQEWGYPVWDGTLRRTRVESFPTSRDEVRIVQYDSCRGLEGWTVVLLGLDAFAAYKDQVFRPDEGDLDDPEDARLRHVARWLLIALTRAIDTLVIELPAANHPLSQAIRDAALAVGDTVEWLQPASE